jgi:hypothetical protein
MTRKRTSLAAIEIVRTPEQPPEPMAAAKAEPKAIRQQTVYLPEPVYEQLRRLAFEERTKMHSLLMEGLDRVFRNRGLPGIDELKGKG